MGGQKGGVKQGYQYACLAEPCTLSPHSVLSSCVSLSLSFTVCTLSLCHGWVCCKCQPLVRWGEGARVLASVSGGPIAVWTSRVPFRLWDWSVAAGHEKAGCQRLGSLLPATGAGAARLPKSRTGVGGEHLYLPQK